MSTKFKKNVDEMVAEFPMKVWVYSEPDGGFSVQSPRLATCFASGDTLPKALHNFKYALFDYFDIPLAKQNTNMITYKFVDLPEPDVEDERELGEIDINLNQLVGAVG